MRVLFLTRRFWPEIGGVETHTLEVSRRLVREKHKVVVVTEASDKISNGREIEGIKIYRIPVTGNERLKKFQIWEWLRKNRKLIEEADVVHCHDVGFWYWPFRFLYPQKPFFVTFHGWEGRFPIPLKNKIVRKISEKMAGGNICVGDYLEKWYKTKADLVTYGGIFVFPPPRRSRGRCLATSEVFSPLVFIGRLEEDTGLAVYLKALDFLKYKILFLGDGKLWKEAEKYGKVWGFVKNVRPYILKSHFVFTSGYLSILEAMACRRLVFAVYDNPLKEDYLKMTPFSRWIIIERNPKGLVEKVKYYLEHPEEERKIVDKAYNWAKKQTWEEVTELYLRLWQKQFNHLII